MSEQWNGVPQNPERDGWHWLLRLAGEKPGVWFWDADAQGWRPALLAEDFVKHLTYLGPCLTPAEVAAAVQAECAVLREACANIVRQKAIELANALCPTLAEEWHEASAKIHALPIPGIAALPIDRDAALAAAEARGMERAAAIAKRFGAKSRASRTVARVASKHLHAQLWDASADAAHDIEAAIRASITAAQGDGS